MVCAIQVTLSGVFDTHYTNTDVPCHSLFTCLYPELLYKKTETGKKTGCGSFPKVGYDYVWFMSTCHANTAEFFQSEYTRKPVKVLSVLVLE